MVPSTYRVRWRVTRGGEAVVRWRSVAAGPHCREHALKACRGAIGGEVLISIRDDDGTIRAVMTSRRELGRWRPELSELPTPVDGDWLKALAAGSRRSGLNRSVRAIMRAAVTDELLTLEQGAAIAQSISLAIDGLGPFSASPGQGR